MAEDTERPEDAPRCPDCGKVAGTYACHIRHISLNTGWAKAAND